MNLLNEASDCRFVTRKWNILSNQLNVNYDGGNEIMYNPEVLKSNTCGYNDAYILVRGNITINRCNQAIPVAFKNCAQFIKCVTKIDGTTIDAVEDLDLVMTMHNLLEDSSNYSDMTDSVCFYSKDETNHLNNDDTFKQMTMSVNLSSIRLNYWEALKQME